jgi:fructokinase
VGRFYSEGGAILKNQGVISLGEAFIDFISIDSTNTNYQQLLGGATVNVAVGTSRLGIPSYYLCKLGTDSNGLFVENELTKEKVDTDYCVRTSNKKICGVYVHINNSGERYFHSYINPTPDVVLTEEDLQRELFHSAKIFYFGSGTLFQAEAKKTTEKSLLYAKETDAIVAFDPNIRLMRWENEEICRKTVCSFLEEADIVKLADDELLFLTESKTLEEGLHKLSNWRIPYVFITMGKEGALAIHGGNRIHVPAKKVNVVDTTGAGDAFMSALLYCFHEKGMSAERIEEYTQFANEIGASVTTEFGALTASVDFQVIKEKTFKNGVK